MANKWFRFKHFLISQDRSAFKVGTDGVLLGAWPDVEDALTVLDIGTGTGLLALMIAQRSSGASITALEIDKETFEQAVENVEESPWKDRIKVLHIPVQDFDPGKKFDLIISNPPFFSDSVKPADRGRMISRHDNALSLEDLSDAVVRLLNESGKFCLVLPFEAGRDFEFTGLRKGLYLQSVMNVRPTPRHIAKRRLMEFRLYPAEAIKFSELTIELCDRHNFTSQYKDLTKDFYLAF